MICRAFTLVFLLLALSADTLAKTNGTQSTSLAAQCAPPSKTVTVTATAAASTSSAAAGSSSGKETSSGSGNVGASAGRGSNRSGISSGNSKAVTDTATAAASTSSAATGSSSGSQSGSSSTNTGASTGKGTGNSGASSGKSGATSGNSGTGSSNVGSTSGNTGSNNNNGNSGNNSANSGAAQTSLTLLQSVIATGFENNGGTSDGQVASLTSSNNFINFCATTNLPITNGLQIKTGSCNPAPMGMIPSTSNMPSSKFVSPVNFDKIAPNTNFTVKMAVQNLETGNFVNATSNYYAAPQQLNNQGNIIGHTHFVIEKIDSFTSTTPLDIRNFAFFKGVNGAAVNGAVSEVVTDGLPAGFYKLSSINAAANHQPVLAPIAQHGSMDDVIYFEVSSDANTGSNSAAGNNSSNAAGSNSNKNAATGNKNTSSGKTKSRRSRRFAIGHH